MVGYHDRVRGEASECYSSPTLRCTWLVLCSYIWFWVVKGRGWEEIGLDWRYATYRFT